MHRVYGLLVLSLTACDDARVLAIGATPDAGVVTDGNEPIDAPESVTPPPADASGHALIGNISAGAWHTCVVVGGGVQCWGDSAYGKLGADSFGMPAGVPVHVAGIASGATTVAAGGDHTCALVDGGVQCWGANTYGQLGNPQLALDSSNPSPVAVTGLSSGVSAVAVGDNHSCALVAGGVMCWGDNGLGQLGVANVAFSATPIWVANLGAGSGVSAIRANGTNSCAIANGGQWCWGDNYAGQLGIGASAGMTSSVPMQPAGFAAGVEDIAIGGGYFICALQGGTVYCAGSDFTVAIDAQGSISSSTPIPNPDFTAAFGAVGQVQALTGGGSFGDALVDGGVRSFGLGVRGGLSPPGLPAQMVVAGAYHSCAIIGSDVECWGWNIKGELGNGTSGNTTSGTPSVVGPWAP